ncbi:MAG: metallophosphoesterase family protein [Bacteroidetes bacterium]|nr:metallophosphoesterase family protein [Bacteroidota bacterium]
MKATVRNFTFLLLTAISVTGYTQNIPFPAGPDPDRIVLNVTEDPSTSLAVTWRTCDTISTSIAEIMEASSDPMATLKAVKQVAHSEKFQYDNISVFYHSYIFKNLKPKTRYMYRVGTENHWSEWFHITTAGLPGDKLSFIYFGDVQAGIKSLWSGVIRAAYAKMPEANAIMYAGDIVNRGEFDHEWGELFYAGNFIHSTIPGIMSPGNHEYAKTKGDKLSAFWRPQFTLPENGPEGVKETAYFSDIQGMRFISLNSNQAEEVPADLESQKQWLDSVLQHNPNKWTCVIFHHPIYSIAPQRDNPWMRDNFKPLFDKYKVDLVMQGHDHAYARGMKKIDGATGHENSGTMYVISMSGAKMYKENQKPWMDKNGGHTQLFQLITVDGNTLSYKSYTATGDLFDTFKLIKQKGKKNKLVED